MEHVRRLEAPAALRQLPGYEARVGSTHCRFMSRQAVARGIHSKG